MKRKPHLCKVRITKRLNPKKRKMMERALLNALDEAIRKYIIHHSHPVGWQYSSVYTVGLDGFSNPIKQEAL